MRGKSTRQSRGTPIFYADITLREGMSMEETLAAAKQLDEQRQHSGFNQDALDLIAREALSNGAFEEDEDDISAVVEEFYPIESNGSHYPETQQVAAISLAEQLERKAVANNARQG